MADYFPSSSNSGESANDLSLRDEPQLLPSNMMMYMNYPSSFEATPGIGISTAQENDQFSTWKDSRNEAMLANPMTEQSNLQGQGLSLSLATEIPSGFSLFGHIPQEKDKEDHINMLHFRNLEEPQSLACSQYEVPTTSKVVPNSEYLKATQQLLDEVVNVKQALKKANCNNKGDDENALSPAEGETSGKDGNDLSPIERQSKLTQLLTMLDKIDRKYKQYYHEMQIVVSSFDTIAGSGAATTYTAVALQTISRHFRSLRDAISGQINATRRSLGESDASSSEKGVGISRLRNVDQKIRERNSLHHLGVTQNHTWRPQRGLPDSSISVLRSWLFEHFLHPYPKDSEKIMLARQTGLTRSQVSNWFINARVRLWKPMVEEMYKEESDFGNMEMDPNSIPGNGSGSPKASSSRSGKSHTDQSLSSKSGEVHDIEMTGSTTLGFQNDVLQRSFVGYEESLMTAARTYQQSERFGNSNGNDGVSLTLGLEHQFLAMAGDEMDLGMNQVQGFIPFSSSSHKLQ